MNSIEQRIFDLVSAIPADSEIEDSFFDQMASELVASGSGVDNQECQREVWEKSLDFYLPDSLQMLYLLLVPRCPPQFVERLKSKPYDHGIKIVDQSYRVDFDVVYKILVESAIERQPLTMITNAASFSVLARRLVGCTYDLPAGSRMVRYTDTPTIPDTMTAEKIFGVPSVMNIYCPPGMTSFGMGVDRYHFPAWTRPMKHNGLLSFIDLPSFGHHGRVTLSSNVSQIDGQYVFP